MANISIDVDSEKNEIYLLGDVREFTQNRFAWRYARSFLDAYEGINKIIIPIHEDETVNLLIKITEMLNKYGFNVIQGNTTEQILLNFQQEEEKFAKFSEKALLIRNNKCDYEEFELFSNTILRCLPKRSLYPLQLLSAYHLAFSQNACNFSVPGAGKTSIVYGAFAYLHDLPKNNIKHVDKLLIVGPLSSFGPWEMEYEECFGHSPISKRLSGGIAKEDKINYLISAKTANITLISYHSLVSVEESIAFFLRTNKVMVVLDEAHKAKNSSGGIIAQAVLSLSKYSKSRIVLTGTPAPNGYEDLYNMFKFIWPNKNIIGYHINQLRDMSQRNNDVRVEQLLQNISPYFVRIKKSDLNIPPAINHPAIYVPMNPFQQRIYDYIEKKYINAIIKENTSDLSDQFKASLSQARIIRLMQAATDPIMLKKPLEDFFIDEDFSNGLLNNIEDEKILKYILEYDNLEVPAKFIKVKELISEIIKNGGKVVVWATFIHTINRLKEYLFEYGIDSQVLYGAIPVEKDNIEEDCDNILTREKIIKDFQQEKCLYSVLIANPYAVSESISLHKACHNAIYIERSFNAAHFVQSKDRIHRYGLAPDIKTHYYYVISENTIDETIDTRLNDKEHRMNEIMESMPIPLFDNISSDFGNDDMKAVIRDYVKRAKKS